MLAITNCLGDRRWPLCRDNVGAVLHNHPPTGVFTSYIVAFVFVAVVLPLDGVRSGPPPLFVLPSLTIVLNRD